MKIGLFGALTVLFIALKLTGTISWSWWLVLIFPLLALSGLIYLIVKEYKRIKR